MIATIVMPKLMPIGGGSIARVAETLGQLRVKRPLVVTDGVHARQWRYLEADLPVTPSWHPVRSLADAVPVPTTDLGYAGAKITGGTQRSTADSYGGRIAPSTRPRPWA